MQIKIGTRKSKLALLQTEIVIAELKKYYSDYDFIITPINTTGDKIKDKNLYDIGGKALFLKELEEQLIDNQIDIAVHSLKDVPGVLPDGLEISAVLERGDPRDCFVSYNYPSLKELPKGAVIGSSSVRRKVIIQAIRPDIKIVPFRGNIQTRLQKLKDGEVDATILATAGLKRAGLFDPEICKILTIDEMLPAAGQGVIAIEVRSDDKKMLEITKKLNHLPTWHVITAERSCLKYLDASCRTPFSAYAELKGDTIYANYMLSDFDSSFIRYHQEIGLGSDAEKIGIKAGEILLGV